MYQYHIDSTFNCTYGCQNANDCQYSSNNANNSTTQQVSTAFPNTFVDNSSNYNNLSNQNTISNQFSHGGDSVVPVNNHGNQGGIPANYEYPNFMHQSNSSIPYEYYVENPNTGNSSNTNFGYFIDNIQSYPPCQGPQPWNYAQCYGYYGEAPCQFAAVGVDMEDFM